MKLENLGKISILYVEDDKTIQVIFANILKKFVKNLYIAENGEEGLEKFNKFNPDIVITDIQMPKMNGIELIEEIRKKNKSIPIIITTAFNNIEYPIKAIKLGIDGFFLKPIEDIQGYLRNLEEKAKNIIAKKENKKKSAIINSIMENFFDVTFFVENKKIVTLNKEAKNIIENENIEYFLKKVTPKIELKKLKKEIIKYNNNFYTITIEEYLQNQFIIIMKKLQ